MKTADEPPLTRAGFEGVENATDTPVGRELALLGEVAIDQPVTECG